MFKRVITLIIALKPTDCLVGGHVRLVSLENVAQVSLTV